MSLYLQDDGVTPACAAAHSNRYNSVWPCVCSLHFAAYHCQPSVVRLLVERGADVTVVDSRGRAPGEAFKPTAFWKWSQKRLVSAAVDLLVCDC